jgi:hypothetical protein
MGVAKWLIRRRGKETRKRQGWERFWREQTGLTSCRGIFGDEKAVRWEDFSVVLRGRRVVKG